MPERLVLATQVGGVVAELYEVGTAPEIYIDGFQGFAAGGSTVKINLFTRPFQEMALGPAGTRVANLHPSKERREMACRLVMGVDTFLNLAEGLATVAGRLRKDMNLLQVEAPKDGPN